MFCSLLLQTYISLSLDKDRDSITNHSYFHFIWNCMPYSEHCTSILSKPLTSGKPSAKTKGVFSPLSREMLYLTPVWGLRGWGWGVKLHLPSRGHLWGHSFERREGRARRGGAGSPCRTLQKTAGSFILHSSPAGNYSAKAISFFCPESWWWLKGKNQCVIELRGEILLKTFWWRTVRKQGYRPQDYPPGAAATLI